MNPAAEQTEQAQAAALLGLSMNQAMCRHMAVLLKIHHAALAALEDEKALGMPLPYGDALDELREVSKAAIEQIGSALKRRKEAGIL